MDRAEVTLYCTFPHLPLTLFLHLVVIILDLVFLPLLNLLHELLVRLTCPLWILTHTRRDRPLPGLYTLPCRPRLRTLTLTPTFAPEPRPGLTHHVLDPDAAQSRRHSWPLLTRSPHTGAPRVLDHPTDRPGHVLSCLLGRRALTLRLVGRPLLLRGVRHLSARSPCSTPGLQLIALSRPTECRPARPPFQRFVNALALRFPHTLLPRFALHAARRARLYATCPGRAATGAAPRATL